MLVPLQTPLPKRPRTKAVFTPLKKAAHEYIPLAADIPQVLQTIEKGLANLWPLKQQMRRHLELAVAQTKSETLRASRLEVVGSSSWGGDVPQSDMDFVLMTQAGNLSGRHAVDALVDLRASLEELSQLLPCDRWHRLELLDSAYVPILRLHWQDGFHCDVSIDQHHSVAHRDLLLQAVEDRPKIGTLVRLIKYWFRCRRLPTSADGGLPSLTWTLIAMRLAMERPQDTSISSLLHDFFQEMQKLGDHSLQLREHRVPSARFGNADGSFFDWTPRDGLASAWANEWIQLISVEDPCANLLSTGSRRATVTPPSIPAALALLYVTDLRLGWCAIQDGRWRDFWRCSMAALPSLSSLSNDQKLHVVIKDGQLLVGKVQEVQVCKAVNPGNVLHHRDQSSRLFFQASDLRRGHACTVYAEKFSSERTIECHPCHLVGLLHVGPRMTLLGEGLARLAEIIQIVGPSHVDAGVASTILSCRRVHAQVAQSVQLHASPVSLELQNSTQEHAGDSFDEADDLASDPLKISHRERKQAWEASDESTRASDSECDSACTFDHSMTSRRPNTRAKRLLGNNTFAHGSLDKSEETTGKEQSDSEDTTQSEAQSGKSEVLGSACDQTPKTPTGHVHDTTAIVDCVEATTVPVMASACQTNMRSLATYSWKPTLRHKQITTAKASTPAVKVVPTVLASPEDATRIPMHSHGLRASGCHSNSSKDSTLSWRPTLQLQSCEKPNYSTNESSPNLAPSENTDKSRTRLAQMFANKSPSSGNSRSFADVVKG